MTPSKRGRGHAAAGICEARLIGGIAASLPFIAHAQERVRRVGVLLNPGPGDAEMQTRIATFVQGLQQLGWKIGHTLQIDYRWSHGDSDRLRVAMWQNWLPSDRTLCKLCFDVLSRDPHVHLRSRAAGRELEPLSQDQVAAVSRVVPTPI
jgi:hypothetical protein